MNNEKYICPRCDDKMSWTGNVAQNPNENRWCSVVYEYKCRNVNCGYKSKYEQLDDDGTRLKSIIDMCIIE